MRNRNGRRGGASVFLCIILSAVILSESVLYFGARKRGLESDLLRCMRLQSGQILAEYDKFLLECYGLYSVDSEDINTNIIMACFPDNAASPQAVPIRPMTSEDLKAAVCDYMKVRLPASAAAGILEILQEIFGQVSESGIFEKNSQSGSSRWVPILTGILENKDKWGEVIATALSLLKAVDAEGALADIEEFADSLRQTAERKSALFVQGDPDVKELNPEGLAGVSGILEHYLNPELPDAVDSLLVNAYAASFFDSMLSMTGEGESRQAEVNLLGIPYETVHKDNHGDLEYILTGIDNEILSFSAVKMLIADVRILVNIASGLADEQKMSKAEEIAGVLSAAIAAVSAGAVVVDPEILQYLVLYVWSAGQAYIETLSLVAGKSIPLIEHSAIKDNDVLKRLLMTEYRDYVCFFLLAVPEEWKLSRMLEVLKRDSSGEIFTGISISVDYRGNRFLLEDTYDAYFVEDAENA